jgi:GpV-like protein with Apex motif
MSDTGYGQINPTTAGSSDLNAIAAIVRQMVNRLDIMKLVKVTAIHPGSGTPPSGGTVDVLPLVNQIDGSGNPVQHGTVFGLPVFRLQAGNTAIIMDPAVGDYGYVVCADRDSSLVLKTPGQANPGSRRRYNLADGVFICGVGSMNGKPTSYLWFKSDGSWTLTAGSSPVLQSISGGIKLTGNLQVTGTITQGEGGGDQVSLATHTHSGVTTGSGTSGPPTPGS